jgi:hypothetical protein
MRGRLPRMSVMISLGSASADDPTESNDCYPYARLNRAALLLLVAAPTLIQGGRAGTDATSVLYDISTGGKLGTGIRSVQTALVVILMALLGFFATQPAMATTVTSPGADTEQPAEPSPTPEPTFPVVIPPVLEPSSPPPTLEPVSPVPAPPSEEPAPAPVVPPVVEPVAPPAEVPAVTPPAASPIPAVPTDVAIENFVVEPEVPAETTTAEPTPTPTPTPTKTAAPPVVSADITGPLKVALAPVAENNPLVQGLTVLVLLLLGLAYFRALRSKGIRGPRLNGK